MSPVWVGGVGGGGWRCGERLADSERAQMLKNREDKNKVEKQGLPFVARFLEIQRRASSALLVPSTQNTIFFCLGIIVSAGKGCLLEPSVGWLDRVVVACGALVTCLYALLELVV